MARRTFGPLNFIEDKPTKQSVLFCGKYINLKHLADDQHINHSYLSKIFSGSKVPSIPYATQLATALGMDRGELITALEKLQVEKRLRKTA